MQKGIVPIRVDYGRLIVQWVIIGVVTFGLIAVIRGSDIGVTTVQNSMFPDTTTQQGYAAACLLFGLVAFLVTGLYPPWLGAPQEDIAKPSTQRLPLVPAGYGWLWWWHRAGDKQAKN